MCAHGQAGVEQQHAAVRPRREEAGVVWRSTEIWVVVLDAGEDVLEGGRRSRGWANGEAETVRLADVVVGVLAEDHRFDGVEGCVLRPVVWCLSAWSVRMKSTEHNDTKGDVPGINILTRWVDLLPALSFCPQEPF